MAGSGGGPMAWSPSDEESALLAKLEGHALRGPSAEGVCLCGWTVVCCRKPILTGPQREAWEGALTSSHLPEMLFGNSALYLHHCATGLSIHLTAFDALLSWQQEKLPPVKIPAATQWESRSKPAHQIVLDYDYTFTTTYKGSVSFVNTSGVAAGDSSSQLQIIPPAVPAAAAVPPFSLSVASANTGSSFPSPSVLQSTTEHPAAEQLSKQVEAAFPVTSSAFSPLSCSFCSSPFPLPFTYKDAAHGHFDPHAQAAPSAPPPATALPPPALHSWSNATVKRSESQQMEEEGDKEAAKGVPPPRWLPAAPGEGIDYALLSQRDPIVFYGEAILYEDELSDSGITMLSAKVRVMSSCWFALLRLWVRVDGALVRIRDTRIFSDFSKSTREGSPVVIREFSEREATFQQLQQMGLPHEVVCSMSVNDLVERLDPKYKCIEKLDLGISRTL